MCIVIDPGSIPQLLNQSAKRHNDLKPILNWIAFGQGKMVYGGHQYREELDKLSRYARVIAEWERAGKVVLVSSDEVNRVQQDLEAKAQDNDFDDAHLIAIVIVSRCLLICSLDKRAYRFVKDKSLYPGGFVRPKIYSGLRCKHLITSRNIAAICKG